MHKSLIVLVAIATGCGQHKATTEAGGPLYYTRVCIGGVTYYDKGHGITIALDRDSKVIPCEPPR